MHKLKISLAVTLVIIMVFLFIPGRVLADTGTYKIDNYTVTLTPQSDGSVDISLLSAVDCFIRQYSLDYSRASQHVLYYYRQRQ